MLLDCAIFGGGPAGLNAALVLGRARRKVVLFDDNQPRNAVTQHSHGFITRDGMHPAEFRAIGQQEIVHYPSVEIHTARIESVRKQGTTFELGASSGETFEARTILLATGIQETLPAVARIYDYYGKSLFNGPYCDGWELRDRPWSFLPFPVPVFLAIGAPPLYFDGMVCAHKTGELHDGIKEWRHRIQVQLDHFMAVFAGQILSYGPFAHMIADGPVGKGETIDDAKLNQKFYHSKGGHARKVYMACADLTPEIFNRKVEVLSPFLRNIRSDYFSWASAFQTRVGQSLQDALCIWTFEIWRVHNTHLLLESASKEMRTPLTDNEMLYL